MYKRVVVPLDGSPRAEAILPCVEQMAGRLGAEVVLVRVEPPASWEVLDLLPALAEDELMARREEAQQYLRTWVRALGRRGLRVDAVVRVGEPPEEIVSFAREIGADLIAMTTRGHGGLRRMLTGSTADAVLRAASVPVLLLSAAP